MSRIDGRLESQLRPVKITRDFIIHPEGSVLIEMGNTKVICNASVEESIPHFKRGSGQGWVTAEYSMLPRATGTRSQRDINRLKQNPRSVEIQRLIARALRASIDLGLLGERSITVDCDVIQADGGTRTASITGGFVALHDACDKLVQKGLLEKNPIIHFVSAISVGVVDGQALLDLCYEEDFRADVDMNVVMADNGEFVEVQGTGEGSTFNSNQLRTMINFAEIGNTMLIKIQKKALEIN